MCIDSISEAPPTCVDNAGAWAPAGGGAAPAPERPGTRLLVRAARTSGTHASKSSGSTSFTPWSQDVFYFLNFKEEKGVLLVKLSLLFAFAASKEKD